MRASSAPVSPPRNRSTRVFSEIVSMRELLRLELFGHEGRAVGQPRVLLGQAAKELDAVTIHKGHRAQVEREVRGGVERALACHPKLVYPGADQPPLEGQGHGPAASGCRIDLEHDLDWLRRRLVARGVPRSGRDSRYSKYRKKQGCAREG